MEDDLRPGLVDDRLDLIPVAKIALECGHLTLEVPDVDGISIDHPGDR
jgi:hypothetical protein